jgi:hypothetical protein
MSDPKFEQSLAAMFADVPPAPDAAQFNLAVMDRLDRHLRWRAWILGACGVAGVLIALIAFARAKGGAVVSAPAFDPVRASHVVTALVSPLGSPAGVATVCLICIIVALAAFLQSENAFGPST